MDRLPSLRRNNRIASSHLHGCAHISTKHNFMRALNNISCLPPLSSLTAHPNPHPTHLPFLSVCLTLPRHTGGSVCPPLLSLLSLPLLCHYTKLIFLSISVPLSISLGLQRRATERVTGGVGRARRDTDPERPQLEHSASFNGMDASRRANGPSASPLGPAGSEPKPSLLTRRNTESQRPSPLAMDGNPPHAGPNSAAPGAPYNRYQDNLDDIDQTMYALNMNSEGKQEYTPPVPAVPSHLQTSPDLRMSPGPTRSNSTSRGVFRRPSQSGASSPPSAYPNGPGAPPMPNNSNLSNYNTSNPPSGVMRAVVTPVLAELRRMDSVGGNGLRRGDSIRSAATGYGSNRGINGRNDEASYLNEPVYAGLRDKV